MTSDNPDEMLSDGVGVADDSLALPSSLSLLRTLTEADIARDGPNCSVMVRSGLLLDIIDLAAAAPGLVMVLRRARPIVEDYVARGILPLDDLSDRLALDAIDDALSRLNP